MIHFPKQKKINKYTRFRPDFYKFALWQLSKFRQPLKMKNFDFRGQLQEDYFLFTAFIMQAHYIRKYRQKVSWNVLLFWQPRVFFTLKTFTTSLESTNHSWLPTISELTNRIICHSVHLIRKIYPLQDKVSFCSR